MMTTDTHDSRAGIRVLARNGEHTASEIQQIAKDFAEANPDARIWYDGDMEALVSDASDPSDGAQWPSDGEPSACKEVVSW